MSTRGDHAEPRATRGVVTRSTGGWSTGRFLPSESDVEVKLDIPTQKPSYESWFQTLCESLDNNDLASPFGDRLPAFPSTDMQRNTTSLAGEQALQQANGFYTDLSNVLMESGESIGPDWQVVDFGSCWGRISRFFMRDVALDHIHGIDVEPLFVETCRGLFRSDKFSACSVMPPSGFQDTSVNLIVAYSVFSHLSESAFKSWMGEFHRILKHGGVVAFTTRGEAFLDYCKTLEHQHEPSKYQKALAGMASNIGNFGARYESGEFIFATGAGMGGGGAMNESFYGEAFISPAYVRSSLGNSFDILDFKNIGNDYDQALFVLRKRY